jgi:hypothetical protein
MNTNSAVLLVVSFLSLGLFLVGCGSAQNADSTVSPDHLHGGQQANLAQLSVEDRSLAEAQGYCPVSGEPLGSMGPPLKLIVNDQPVFICCNGCEKKATSQPDQTLAKVTEFKAKVKSEGAR